MVYSLKTKLRSLNKKVIISIIVTLSSLQASYNIPQLDLSKIQRVESVKPINVEKEEKIYNYIKKVNSNVKDLDAAKMSVAFIKAKKEFKNVPTATLVSVINTESSFDVKVKHDIKAVIGIGGIYTKYWFKPLKEAGIVKNINDLKKPEVNIRATAFVLNYYLELKEGNLKKALTAYKGVSRVGAQRAVVVLNHTRMLKKSYNI